MLVTLTFATVVSKKLRHISSYVHFIQSSSKHFTTNKMSFYHTSKFLYLAAIWSQKNLIVETSPLHMLFIRTFQPQNVFSDVYTSSFVFVCMFVLVFVIILAFSSKFWVAQVSFECLCTSRLGCLRKSSQSNISTFIFPST